MFLLVGEVIGRRKKMMQLIFRILFLLVDVIGNIFILSTHQTLPLGDLHLDYVALIVVFNAAMLLVVYVVDLVIFKLERYLIDIDIGEGFTNHRGR